MNEKNKNKAAIIVVTLLILFLIAVVILMFTVVSNNSGQILQLPAMNFTMIDPETGPHNINTKMAFVSKSAKLDQRKKTEVNDTIKKAIEKADYEKLTGDGGFEYMKSTVQAALKEKYGDDIGDIYVSNFSCDLAEIGDNTDAEEQRDEVMNGLFPNLSSGD